jgi:hypothetical protein
VNPNSANQYWSKWIIDVVPARPMRGPKEIEVNVARFLRKMFGAAASAKFTLTSNPLRFEVLAEGHPATDPTYVAYCTQNLQKFFTMGFGLGTQVSVAASLEAGSAQDGTPSAQLVVLPSLIG